MIINIIIGVSLIFILIKFIILNNKINIIQDYLNTTVVNSINNINCNLLDELNNRTLIDNEHFKVLKDLIEKNKIEINNSQELLYNFPVKLETFIAEENNSIHKEIKKLAKISSRKKSQSKTNKSTK